MKRGQIYYIESNHQEIGSEQRAGRPAVIVSIYSVSTERLGTYIGELTESSRSLTSGSSNRRTCRTEKPAGLQALIRSADREAA